MVGKTPAIARGAAAASEGLVPEKFGSIARGAAVPDVAFEGQDGKALTLASLKGKRVLLHFHTSKGPQPWIDSLVKSYADQGVTTLCVFSLSLIHISEPTRLLSISYAV